MKRKGKPLQPPSRPPPTEKKEGNNVKASPFTRPYLTFFFLFPMLLLIAWFSLQDTSPAAKPPPKILPKTSSTSLATLTRKLLPQNLTTFLSTCDMYPTPHAEFTQKCCLTGNTGNYICFPNLVVLGTQKSGTTALFSYLLSHPQIRVGPKKEMHLFDFDKNFLSFTRFVPWVLPSTNNMNTLLTTVVADATPSYLADYKSCFRMKRILGSDTRYVIMLRNPVERVWSDVLMKERRLAFQEDFLLRVLPLHVKEVKACLDQRPLHFLAFRACLPREMGHHGRASTFFKWTQMAPPTTLNTFMQRCLVGEREMRECVSEGGLFHLRILGEIMPEVPRILYEEAKTLTTLFETCCARPQQELNIGCGMECFPRFAMMSDVMFHHLFRSLYVVQLEHCFADLDPHHVLVFNSEDLRTHPDRTLNTLLTHVGLNASQEMVNSLVKLSSTELQNVFHKTFPEFENISGWSRGMNLNDMDMPPELAAFLNDFFRPWNRKLFAYLKQEPFEGWAV